MSVEVFAYGVEEVVRDFGGLAARVADSAPALKLISRSFEAAEVRHFESEGGGAWPPLARSTVARKSRQGKPTASLVDSGRLRASLTQHTGDSVRHVGPTSLVFGTAVPYARFHEYGTSKMPRRSPLVSGLRVDKFATNTLAKWIVGRFGRLGSP